VPEADPGQPRGSSQTRRPLGRPPTGLLGPRLGELLQAGPARGHAGMSPDLVTAVAVRCLAGCSNHSSVRYPSTEDLCATVSVVEAVREDRWQAWRRHHGMTRCATGTPWGLPLALSCLPGCRRRPGPPRWPDQQSVQPAQVVTRHSQSQRTGAKSDALDAVRAAREALGQDHLASPRRQGEREALRVLQATRRSATTARVAAIGGAQGADRGRPRGAASRAARAQHHQADPALRQPASTADQVAGAPGHRAGAAGHRGSAASPCRPRPTSCRPSSPCWSVRSRPGCWRSPGSAP
jgi:hypothetical protein